MKEISEQEGRNKIFTTLHISLLNFWFTKRNDLRFIKRTQKYVNVFVLL